MLISSLLTISILLLQQQGPAEPPIKCGSHGTDAFQLTFSNWTRAKTILMSHDEHRIGVLVSKKGLERIAIINGAPSRTHMSRETFLARIHGKAFDANGFKDGKGSAPDHVYAWAWIVLHDSRNKERITNNTATISSGDAYAVVRFFCENGILRIASIKATVSSQ